MARVLVWTIALAVLLPGLAHAQPTGEAEKLRKQAAQLHADGDHDGAADKLREALVHSNHARIYFDLCLVLEAAKKLNQARSSCRAVRHGDDADDALLGNARRALDRINRKLSGDTTPDPDPPPPDPDPPPPDREPDPVPPGGGPGGGQPNGGGQSNGGGTVTQPPPLVVQPPPPKPLVFGVKIGVNVANTTGDDSFGDSKSDLGIGGFGVYTISPMIGLGVEALLMGKGTQVDSGLGFTATIDLLYLEIPVTGRLTFAVGELVKIHGFVGFAPAFLLSATDEDGDDIGDGTSEVDVGFVLGVGASYSLGGSAIVADLRTTRGLIPLDSSDDPVDVRNTAFSFLAGYQF